MRRMGVRDGASPCPSVQEAEGSTPAPRTVADGRAPTDRTRTAPVSRLRTVMTSEQKGVRGGRHADHPTRPAGLYDLILVLPTGPSGTVLAQPRREESPTALDGERGFATRRNEPLQRRLSRASSRGSAARHRLMLARRL